MMTIAAAMLFICYALTGLFLLAVSPAIIGLPFMTACITTGLWVSNRMMRTQVQPI